MSINGPDEPTSNASQRRPDGGFLSFLRALAMIAAVAGAVGSVGLMLWVGHRNPSRLLLALFVIWDVAPFIALAGANTVSKRWPVLTQATLFSVTLVISVASLAIYGNVAFGPPRSTPAFMFLVVPPASWVMMTIAVSIAALISRNSPGQL
jgi:hypothetical protein